MIVIDKFPSREVDDLNEGDLQVAFSIAHRAHEGVVDKVGQPYFHHPLWVMDHVSSIADKIVGILHDVVEDSDITLDDLRVAGLPEELVLDLDALSKRPHEPLEDAMARVRRRPRAVRVKRADMAHNTLPERVAALPEMVRARLAVKYDRQALALHTNIADIHRQFGVTK